MTAPTNIIVEAMIFLFRPSSLKIFTPKNTLTIVDNWNKESAYPTLMFEKT